jgi:uncharacterized protein
MKNVYSVKSFGSSAIIKDIDGKKGIVSGYFSNFGNVDSDGDIIRPGAFSKSIQENGPQSATPRIKHLMNHNINLPLGSIQTLQEDTKGLAYESQIGTHTIGQDFIKMVESGLITEHSIGFRIVKENQLQTYEDYRANPSKGWHEITEIKLYEGSSLTGWGANQLTPLTGMKSEIAEVEYLEKRMKAIETFCRKTTASDELIESLLIECKQLTQIICDIKNATKPGESTLPEEKFAQAINQFLKSKN